MLWLQFLVCSLIIVASGVTLSKYGDVLAEKTGLGGAWIGLILMASVTSLPELIAGISSVVMVNAPDIAVGAVMGSCVYNIAILAFMDILNGRKPLFATAGVGHLISAGFGIILISIVILSMHLVDILPSLGYIGLYTPVIVVVYLLAVRCAYFYERKVVAEFVEDVNVKLNYGEITMKRAILGYSLSAAVIIAAATWLPFIADALGEQTGLGRTFMGSFFVGMTTSLPELVVSITAVRIGATDMAIANLLGSNLFNVLVLAVDDLFYTKGPILSHVTSTHGTIGLFAVIMTAVVVVGLIYRPEKKPFLSFCWSSIALIFIWTLSVLALYLLGSAA
ncbi:MAG: sodium:calcium antiporter [Deltaproteobacteria bacterium]|nr:sodium:calcium antiporter [Deltaproteobacteria bacterium]